MVRPVRGSSSVAHATSGFLVAERHSSWSSCPMLRGSPWYQLSGSALMTRSGMSGWAKKKQCHPYVTNRAVMREMCSVTGGQSMNATRETVSG